MIALAHFFCCAHALTWTPGGGDLGGTTIRDDGLRAEHEASRTEGSPYVLLYPEEGCRGEPVVVGPDEPASRMLRDHGTRLSFELKGGASVADLVRENSPVSGAATFDHAVWGSVVPGLDKCQPLEQNRDVAACGVQFRPEASAITLPPTRSSAAQPKYQVVFSCDSSMYMARQVLAMTYSFHKVVPDGTATLTRLLTGAVMDDLGGTVATFQAPRNVRSNAYSPYNKADVLSKWLKYSSPEADVVVLMDPDNWLLKDLSPLVDRVAPGHSVATPAFYSGSGRSLYQLWQELCEHNCDVQPVPAAVPYLVHAEDLKRIAPLWKHYLDKMLDMPEEVKNSWKRYPLQMDWCVEMVAYNLACAHAGLETSLEESLQIRDVDGERLPRDAYYAIHVGRIWFPHGYKPAQKFHTRDERQWSDWGHQAWVKTEDIPVPWTGEYPPGMPFVSQKTLEYLHESQARYGEPTTSAFRVADLFDQMD